MEFIGVNNGSTPSAFPSLEVTMPREVFAVTLKMLRLQHGLTQQELAEQLGISAVTISGYELGRREPSIEILERIADCFGVSVDYLLGRTNN